MSCSSWLRPVSVVAASLPAIALLACVAIAVAYHAEDTLSTHCRNVNRLPSISAAVGQVNPEKRIWSNCIAASCALRLLVALAYHQELSVRLVPGGQRRPLRQPWLPAAHLGLNCAELLSLLGLSLVASSDNYTFHRNCFIAFLLSSFVYMLLHLTIAAAIRHPSSSPAPLAADTALITTRSFIAKLLIFAAYCASILLAVYFFARHQAYCEDMMYTYFAASEYAVVYANILFHFTAYFDLGHVPIRLVVCRALATGSRHRHHHKQPPAAAAVAVASPLARRNYRRSEVAIPIISSSSSSSSSGSNSWESQLTLASVRRAAAGFDTPVVSADSHVTFVVGLGIIVLEAPSPKHF